MKMTQRMYDAVNTVAILHNGQYRKDKVTPFITHPFFVGMVLSRYTDDEDVVIAGLFHDVLEDVPGQTRDHIASGFGDRVADIVVGVTHNTEIDWKTSRTDYLDMLRSGSEESLMVACADKIHNITSHIEGVRKGGEQFWSYFSAPKQEYKWFYESTLSIAQDRLKNPIVDELRGVVQRANEEIFAPSE